MGKKSISDLAYRYKFSISIARDFENDRVVTRITDQTSDYWYERCDPIPPDDADLYEIIYRFISGRDAHRAVNMP